MRDRHPLDTMTVERAKELMCDPDSRLTPGERAAGYAFCCNWDSLVIHASHPEADSCDCLKEFRKANNIEDFGDVT